MEFRTDKVEIMFKMIFSGDASSRSFIKNNMYKFFRF